MDKRGPPKISLNSQFNRMKVSDREPTGRKESSIITSLTLGPRYSIHAPSCTRRPKALNKSPSKPQPRLVVTPKVRASSKQNKSSRPNRQITKCKTWPPVNVLRHDESNDPLLKDIKEAMDISYAVRQLIMKFSRIAQASKSVAKNDFHLELRHYTKMYRLYQIKEIQEGTASVTILPSMIKFWRKYSFLVRFTLDTPFIPFPGLKKELAELDELLKKPDLNVFSY